MSDVSTEATKTSIRTTGSSKRKTKSRVSFQGDEKKQTTHVDVMKTELERMRKRDEEEERRKKEYREREVQKMREKLDEERRAKGIKLVRPDLNERKQDIKNKLDHEIKEAMQEERSKLAVETDRMKNVIGIKHGLHTKKKVDIVRLAQEFAKPNKSTTMLGLPERVHRELTMGEIVDLRKIFDMYDVAGDGHISRKDVIRISCMLGLSQNKEACRQSIEEICKSSSGRVSFVHFLDFVIKNQEGSDPFEEVQQCFRLLDTEDKGYLNFDDIRAAADEFGLNLSNRMIQEMLDDADASGDAEVGPEEFTMIMLRTTAFNV